MTHAKPRTVLLASGGTGGHISPALALADELHARGIAVLFATDRRGEKYIKDRAWLTTHVVRAGTFRKHPVRLIKDMANLSIGILQSFDLIRDHNPDVVVGFGGYPCFPPVLAAQILRIPTLLHEQNAVIGKANAMLAKVCTRLALSLPDFSGLSSKQKTRTVVTGNPVRHSILQLAERVYTPPDATGPFHLVILSGSQGAASLGLSLARMIVMLPAELRTRLHVVHQVRAEDVVTAGTLYRDAGITARTAPYIGGDDLTDALRNAHLFIGRSGASTVAEMNVVGIPAIYIPYPHHKDMQQLKNAQITVNAGGAVIIEERDLTAERVLAELTHFMQNPAMLAHMAIQARACGFPRAAQNLADAVLALAPA